MTTAHRYALPPGHRLGEYCIDRYLGSGGFGITYLATDENLNLQVAIKEYLPSDLAMRDADNSVVVKTAQDEDDFEWGRERFLDEARSLARFNHPNIVRVQRFLEAHGTSYIVMDYVEGEPLSDVLARKGAISEAEIHQLVLPLANGLADIHEAGLLHRDIKPSNIIIRDDSTPVLIDFGSARQAVGMKSRSMTSVVTPGYAPLEQYAGKSRQGPATDIYAFGAVLYRCVTGKTPDDATERAIEDVLTPAAQAAVGDYSAVLLTAIDAAMALRMEGRPDSIATFLNDLGEFESPEDHSAVGQATQSSKAGQSGGLAHDDEKPKSMDIARDSRRSDPASEGGNAALGTGRSAVVGFKHSGGLNRWTAVFLYAQMAMSILAISSGDLELQLLRDMSNGAYATEEALIAAASASDDRQTVIGFVQTAVFITSAILILVWIHRTAVNVRQLGVTGLRFTPGWCVGWYFIPFASLWKPYQAMKEIWRASADPSNWQGVRRSTLLPWWWLCWLIWNVASSIAARMSLGAEEIDDLMTANVAIQVSDLLTLPVCLLFLVIMRRIISLQTEHAGKY